jgi:hypothetical protein
LEVRTRLEGVAGASVEEDAVVLFDGSGQRLHGDHRLKVHVNPARNNNRSAGQVVTDEPTDVAVAGCAYSRNGCAKAVRASPLSFFSVLSGCGQQRNA